LCVKVNTIVFISVVNPHYKKTRRRR